LLPAGKAEAADGSGRHGNTWSGRATAILRGESGQALIITALCMSGLMGAMALAIDVGNLQYKQRQLQTAADSAAIAAGLELGKCSDTVCATMQTAAAQALIEDGISATTITPTVNQSTSSCTVPTSTVLAMTINVGPCVLGTGDPNNGNAHMAEVVLTQPQRTFFGAFVGISTVNLVARAEAGQAYINTNGGGSGPCMNTNNLTINSGASITQATGSTCGINDNAGSGLSTNSGVTVNVSYFTYHGATYNDDCGSCSTYAPMPATNSPTVPDPFSSLTAPSAPAISSTNTAVISGNTTLQPGTYTSTINFNSGTYTVNLAPGLYYFNGGLNIDSNVTIQGTGVTLFFPSGSSVNINSAATWNLTAPSAALSDCASCSGMVVWDTGNSLDLDANSGSSFGGALYVPNGEFTMNSNSGATAFGMIYANSIMLDSDITLSCSSMPGGNCPGGSGSGASQTLGTFAVSE